jgi:hypothetical protein
MSYRRAARSYWVFGQAADHADRGAMAHTRYERVALFSDPTRSSDGNAWCELTKRTSQAATADRILMRLTSQIVSLILTFEEARHAAGATLSGLAPQERAFLTT